METKTTDEMWFNKEIHPKKKWVSVDGLIKRIDEIAGKGAKPADKFEEGWERGLFELKDEIVECQK